jgi:hypothetical protein
MTLTFLATQAASCGAHLQHPADDLLVRAGAARGNSAGDVADVGTIQIQTDTLRQVLNIVFSQTRICAGRTYLSAGVALLDASDQLIVDASPHVWMGSDHLMSPHWAFSVSWCRAYDRSGCSNSLAATTVPGNQRSRSQNGLLATDR